MNRGDWKSRLAGFMRGRYGIDELYRAMLALSVFFLALNLIYVLPPFLLMGMLFGIFAAIRVFSRNTEKRAAENRWYLALRTRLKQRALRLINRYRDRYVSYTALAAACAGLISLDGAMMRDG